MMGTQPRQRKMHPHHEDCPDWGPKASYSAEAYEPWIVGQVTGTRGTAQSWSSGQGRARAGGAGGGRSSTDTRWPALAAIGRVETTHSRPANESCVIPLHSGKCTTGVRGTMAQGRGGGGYLTIRNPAPFICASTSASVA